MSNLYNYSIRGSSADGDLISAKMSQIYERAYLYITFYSESTFENIVTPSGGSLTFTASEDGQNFGSINNGLVNVTTESYDRPNFSGPVRYVKATADSITGAPFYIATISKYRS